MKKIFWLGITGIILFEIANVYFIMPMPGSQQMNSISLAYFLYTWRWVFRIIFGLMIAVSAFRFAWKQKWVPAIGLIAATAIIYLTNFVMAADHMFYQVKNKAMVTVDKNTTDTNRLVLGVTYNGEAKAYPINYLGYHHQLQDTVGGKPLLITYCTVCRTGRVFQPIVNGMHTHFRLVGMDHFNAMLEDETTKSWWRQATGEAIAGKLKGQQLPEFFSTQTSLAKWIQLHPNTLIMQSDIAFKNSYDSTFKYESGKSKSKLTGTDSLSWKNKSWVIGAVNGKTAKAYDWNKLQTNRFIFDKTMQPAVLLVLAQDDKSFFAFEIKEPVNSISLQNDIIFINNHRYKIDGTGIDIANSLLPIPAYQEFFHSWKTFHPNTLIDK